MIKMESDSKSAGIYLRKLLSNGATIPVDTDLTTSNKQTLPPWYNEELFKKAQIFYKRNIFAIFLGMLCGLISVLSIPTIAGVLLCTNKSSSPLTAYRRYMKTIFHVVRWNSENVKQDSSAWKSLLAVRKIHLSSSKMCQRATNNNLFISQKDMALTQFGFMGYITLKADQLGIGANEEYLDATVHFWRVVGYVLGIKDEFNICTDAWSTTKPRLNLVLNELYKPALLRLDEKVVDLIKAMISGLWSFNFMLSFEAFLFFTKRLAGCEGYEYLESDLSNTANSADERENLVYKTYSLWTRILIFIVVMLHQYILKLSIFRIYFNSTMHASLFIIYYFPFLAFPRFGLRKSYVRIIK